MTAQRPAPLSGRLFALAIVYVFLALAAPASFAQGQVYVSRFWHNHQPIYWPEWNGNGTQNSRVQYAWDSIVLKDGQTYGTGGGHPEDNLSSIFGVDDRKAAYQGRPRDSLSAVGGITTCLLYTSPSPRDTR